MSSRRTRRNRRHQADLEVRRLTMAAQEAVEANPPGRAPHMEAPSPFQPPPPGVAAMARRMLVEDHDLLPHDWRAEEQSAREREVAIENIMAATGSTRMEAERMLSGLHIVRSDPPPVHSEGEDPSPDGDP